MLPAVVGSPVGSTEYSPAGLTPASGLSPSPRSPAYKQLGTDAEGASSSEFIAYGARWWMLALFSLLTASNAMLWITYAPIATLCADAYSVSANAINWLSMMFMYVYILGAFPAAHVVETKSLRDGLLVSCLLNVVGAALRVLPFPFASIHSSNLGFVFACVGQFVCALAQTFTLSAPSKLAQNWFPSHERVTATSVGALANQFGVAIGFFIPPMVARYSTGRIQWVMITEAGITTFAALLLYLFFQSKPETPPSASAAKSFAAASFTPGQEGKGLDPSYIDSIGHEHEKASPSLVHRHRNIKTHVLSLLQNCNFMLLFSGFGCGIGVFYAVSTLLQQYLAVFHYSSTVAGNLGVVIVMTGLFGAFAAGWLADRCRLYHRALAICSFMGFGACMVAFTTQLRVANLTALVLCCGALGIFMTAILPICLDISVEVAYPIPESVPTTLLMIAAQIFGIILITTLGNGSKDNTAGSVHVSAWILTGATAAALLCLLLFQSAYNRLQTEGTGDL